MNTRRIIKHWLKDIQRGRLTYTALEQKFLQLGISTRPIDIQRFMKLNIRGAILARIGRAAKKAGCLVSLYEVNLVAEGKNESTRNRHQDYFKFQEYHLLKFYRQVRKPYAQLEIGEYVIQEGLLNGIKIEERTIQMCRGERFEVDPVAARQILDAAPAYTHRITQKQP